MWQESSVTLKLMGVKDCEFFLLKTCQNQRYAEQDAN